MTSALVPAERPAADTGPMDTAWIGPERDAVVDAAIAGDQRAFAVLVERHRPELHRHCIRMLRSSEQAEDAVQETLLRAWRHRSHFAWRASFRAWLYRIATNACLDEIRRDRSRPRRQAVVRLVPLDGTQLPPAAAASPDPGPAAVLEANEELERALLAVIELLPPKQRAVLILCEVMRYPASDAARLLDTSTAAVNSALQRARATLSAERGDPEGEPISVVGVDPAQRGRLDRYVDALRRHDVDTVVGLARADAIRPIAAAGRAESGDRLFQAVARTA
jgi:RNA polymerase sigma-70 factor, ECF subfamily